MNMENFGNVPENKREEFAASAGKGKELKQESEDLAEQAKYAKMTAKFNATTAVALGGMAAASASGFSENPITGAVVGAGLAALYGRDAVKGVIKGRQASVEAAKAKVESEKSFGISRDIVTEEMLKGGAAPLAQREDGMVVPELNATPEQIEIARKEMNEDSK